MIEKEEIFKKVREIVENKADISFGHLVTGTTRLKEDLCCDSLDGVEISMELDKTFRINTTDSDIEVINNGTVSDIVDMVESKLTQKNKKS